MSYGTDARADRRDEREDYENMMSAAEDERRRFNDAIKAGAWVVLKTHAGDYEVDYVDNDFWYHTKGFWSPSFAGSNDPTWADLLRQAGVARNQRWG